MDIINTIADGFDPQALDKIKLDSQERLALLDMKLPTGMDPSQVLTPVTFDYQPFIPKDYSQSDLMFTGRNNVNMNDLFNSEDPEQRQLAYRMATSKAVNSPAFKKGWWDDVYKKTDLMRKMENDGYVYDRSLSPEQNEERARLGERDKHWTIINRAMDLGKFLGRSVAKVATSLGRSGSQMLGGLDYIFGLSDKKDFISAISDNMYLRNLERSDKNISENFLSSYKQLNYDNKGFFEKFGVPQFWTDEMADVAGFLGAAWLTGGTTSGILKGISPRLATSIGSSSKYGKLLNKGLKFFMGADDVAGIGAGLVNMNMEASVEAASTYKQIKDDLNGKINPETQKPYTDVEIQDRAAKAASTVYNGNLGILMFSNGFQNRLIQRTFGKTLTEVASDLSVDKLGKVATKQFKNETLNKIAKNWLGKRAIHYAPELIEGFIKEGYWEENGQTAITRLAEGKYGKGFYERISDSGVTQEKVDTSSSNVMDFFKQLGRQTMDSATWLGGKGDHEVSTAIGISGLLTVGGVGISTHVPKKSWSPDTGQSKWDFWRSDRREQEKERLKIITELSEAKDNFLGLQDIYKGDSKIAVEKLRQKNGKIKDLIDKFDLTEDISNPIVREQLQKTIFSELALAHIVNNTWDKFRESFSENKSEEELALFGFSKENLVDPNEYIQLGDKLKQSFDQIQKIRRMPTEDIDELQYQNYNSLANRRLFEVHSKNEINDIALEKLGNRLSDFGIFNEVSQYEQLQNEYNSLKGQEDVDGTLYTRKQIIKDKLSELEPKIGDAFEKHGEQLRDDVIAFEKARLYKSRLAEDIIKYSNPVTSLKTFIDEFHNNVMKPIEDEIEEVDEEETPYVPTVEEVNSLKGMNYTDEDIQGFTEEQLKNIIANNIPKEVPQDLSQAKTISDLDNLYNSLSEEEKKNREKEYNDRKDTIYKDGFEAVLNNPQTEKRLRNAWNKLPKNYQDLYKDRYNKELEKFSPKDRTKEELEKLFISNSLKDINRIFSSLNMTERKIIFDFYNNKMLEIQESNFQDVLNNGTNKQLLKSAFKSLPEALKNKYKLLYKSKIEWFDNRVEEKGIVEQLAWQTPQKTIFLMTSDKEDYLEELNDDEIGFDYNEILANEVLPLLNDSNKFIMEWDTYNVKNIKDFEKVAGIIIKVLDSEGNPAKISDYSTNKKYKDSPVIFSMDIDSFISEPLFSERISIFAKNNGIDEAEARKVLTKLQKNKEEARNAIMNNHSLKIPIDFISAETTFSPREDKITKVEGMFNSKIKDIRIDDDGMTQVELENGYVIPSFMNLVKDFKDFDLYKIFKKQYENKQSATQAKIFLEQFIYTNDKLKLIVDNNKIKLVKDSKIIEDENFNNLRLSQPQSSLLQKGFIDEDGNTRTAEEYKKILKNNLITNYKIIIRKSNQKQYFGNVHPYMNFSIKYTPKVGDKVNVNGNKGVIVGANKKLTEKQKSVINLLSKINKKTLKVNPKNNDEYIDKEGKIYKRVSTLNGKANIPRKFADRGTIIDGLLRNFIDDKYSNIEEFTNGYIKIRDSVEGNEAENFSDEFLKNLFDIFTKVREQSYNLHLEAGIPTLWGNINGEDYAGTIDLLGITENGEVYIIDLKTSSVDLRNEYTGIPDKERQLAGDYTYNYKEKHSTQQSAYAELLRQITGIEVKGISIFPLQVSLKNNEYQNAKMSQDSSGKLTLGLELDPKIFNKKTQVPLSKLDRLKAIKGVSVTGSNDNTITEVKLFKFMTDRGEYAFNKESGDFEKFIPKKGIWGIGITPQLNKGFFEEMYNKHPFNESNKGNTIYKKDFEYKGEQYTFYGLPKKGHEYIMKGEEWTQLPLSNIIKDENNEIRQEIENNYTNIYC